AMRAVSAAQPPRSPWRRLERELGERPDRDTGRAFGHERPRLVGPRGTRNVDVRPGQAAGELLQEERCRNRRRGTAAGVAEVGDLALQLLEVVIEDRHRPETIALARP